MFTNETMQSITATLTSDPAPLTDHRQAAAEREKETSPDNYENMENGEELELAPEEESVDDDDDVDYFPRITSSLQQTPDFRNYSNLW